MSNLPNELILKIIREADGGKYAHETKYTGCMGELKQLRDDFHECWEFEYNEGDVSDPFIFVSDDRNYSFLRILSNTTAQIENNQYFLKLQNFNENEWEPYEEWCDHNCNNVHRNFKPEWY